MMNDDTYEKLNDYLDGLLPEDERRAFEARLASDAELHAEAEALRSLSAQASALPREIAPERDLWVGVAAQIGGDESKSITFRRASRTSRRAVWSPLLGLAAMGLLVFGITTLMDSGVNTVVPPDTPTPVAESPVTPEPDAELQRVTAQYLDARAQLVALLDERKADIAPETFAVVEENLSVIAAAVTEIEVALADKPANPKLERMLFAAYQSEVDLLQRAVMLADALPAGGSETDESQGGDDAV